MHRRQMLQPDRKDIKWDEGKLPPWATPVLVNMGGGDLAVAAEGLNPPSPPSKPKRGSLLQRFEALNSK